MNNQENSNRNYTRNEEERGLNPNNENMQSNNTSNQNMNFVNHLFTNPQEAIAKQMMERAGEQITKSWMDRLKCNLGFLQIYFDITTDEIKDRLINSLIPFNPKFHDICIQKPDLYGPFWIYTTLIFAIAACGSLTHYLNGNTTEEYFQQYIPSAASIV